MSNYLRIYRRFVDSSYVPRILKRIMGRFAKKRHQALFLNRHTRLTEYPICLMGHQFKFNVDLQDYTDSDLIYSRFYEEPNIRLLKHDLNPGDVFIDGGANIGWFSIFASQLVGDRGKVFAIEPCPRNAYVLKQNIQSNHITNAFIHQVALTDRVGRIELKGRLLNSGAGTVVDDFGKDPVVDAFIWRKTVDTLTLTEFFKRNDVRFCKWLKLDLQGAEHSVIQSSYTLFEQGRIQNMIVESSSLYPLNEVYSHLNSYGYRAGKICGETIQWIKPDESFSPKRDYLFTRSEK